MAESAASAAAAAAAPPAAAAAAAPCEDPLEFWDSHFHIWDATEEHAALQGGCDPAILGGATPGDDKNYRYARLAAELAPLNGRSMGLVYAGGCFIEAMSVCFPGSKTAAELNPLCVQEARWAERELPPHFFSCPSAQLHAPNAAATVAAVAAVRNARGLRMILNYRKDEPEKRHPRNDVDFLADPVFQENFALLAEHDLHFEAQLEATQFAAALDLFRRHPDVPVVINHFGCPKLEELASDESPFWKGMRAFQALPQAVYVKLSMLCRVDPDWEKNAALEAAVHKLIRLFTPRRCFFASNYPVDAALGWPATRLFPAFLKLAEGYSREDREALFSRSARTAYRALEFASAAATMAALEQALSERDLETAVACHSRDATITVLRRQTGATEVFRGHVGARRFYRAVFAKADKGATASTVAADGAQALLRLGGCDGEPAAYVETNAFGTSHHVCSKTVVE